MPPTTPLVRISPWEWLQTMLLAVNLLWTTLCLGGYLPGTMVVTSWLTAALLLVHAVGWWQRARRGAGWRPHPAGWLFLPFLAYAAVNVAWVSPVHWLGWMDWLTWAQLIAVFWVVLNGNESRLTQRLLYVVLFTLAVVAVVLGCHQKFVDPTWLMLGRTQAEQFFGRASGPFGIPNSLAAFLMLLLPVAGALTLRRGASAAERVFYGWLTLVLLLGVGITISRGGWLALALALTVWPLLAAGDSWRRRMARAVLALAVVAVVGTLTYAVSPAVQERFDDLARGMGERSRPILWRAGWSMFGEKPVWGTGGGSFDVLFERYRPEGFLLTPRWAHNDYLNTLSDYGLVGFLLFFGAAGVVVVRAYRGAGQTSVGGAGGERLDALDDRWVRQAQGIGLLAFGLQLFVDFHFKLPALAMTFATLAAITVRRAWPAGSQAVARGKAWLAVPGAMAPIAAAVATVWVVVPQYRAEKLRQDGRRLINELAEEATSSPRFREHLEQAREALSAAVVLAPGNAQAWADLAYMRAQASRADPRREAILGRLAEADANRAVALAPLLAEAWVRRGVARDMQGRWNEAGDDFAKAIKLSPKSVLPWFHYAYHLAQKPAGHELAKALVEFCLRLDGKNSESLRLRDSLATGHTGR
ncbi:O-antigen ligase family protein [Opitutus sp. ER46]|uniref:O-antigen ligase family protein n=1 Tax=Opitutus sp. ER46 TaxID=2161864 RepID=UPI000D310E4E|nr:O-antigen ligase family protein [Opitutus sp. ER46]PTX96415.1 hypothetical protein DB354_07050 [Opitutus sp. ER46]